MEDTFLAQIWHEMDRAHREHEEWLEKIDEILDNVVNDEDPEVEGVVYEISVDRRRIRYLG